MGLAPKQTHRSMKQNNLYLYGQLIYDKGSKSGNSWKRMEKVEKFPQTMGKIFFNNCVGKIGQLHATDFWTLRERVGWLGRMVLKHVYYHVRNESPVYVQYRIQDAWGWCMRMIQRDDMGWEVGGGFRIGNSCTPVVDSYQCKAKPIQYCKVK